MEVSEKSLDLHVCLGIELPVARRVPVDIPVAAGRCSEIPACRAIPQAGW
jgi:hypothetical protein